MQSATPDNSIQPCDGLAPFLQEPLAWLKTVGAQKTTSTQGSHTLVPEHNQGCFNFGSSSLYMLVVWTIGLGGPVLNNPGDVAWFYHNSRGDRALGLASTASELQAFSIKAHVYEFWLWTSRLRVSFWCRAC